MEQIVTPVQNVTHFVTKLNTKKNHLKYDGFFISKLSNINT